jgi:hypothetical protein
VLLPLVSGVVPPLSFLVPTQEAAGPVSAPSGSVFSSWLAPVWGLCFVHLKGVCTRFSRCVGLHPSWCGARWRAATRGPDA